MLKVWRNSLNLCGKALKHKWAELSRGTYHYVCFEITLTVLHRRWNLTAMASPIQFTVDLNGVFKSVSEIRKAGLEFEDDLADLSLIFRRELSQTERYERIITTGKYATANLLEVISESERLNLQNSLSRVSEYKQKFNDIVTKYTQPQAEPDASLALKSSVSIRRSRSKYSWATGGKIKAEKTLNRLQNINSRLKEDIDMLLSEYTKSFPRSASKIENDPDAQEVGISTTTTLRAIERNERGADSSLKISPHVVQSLEPIGGSTTLSRGKIGNSSTVLVEYRGYTELTDDVSERALRLATFLNRPKPSCTTVLHCCGVFNEVEKRRFGYVFDTAGLFDPREVRGNFQSLLASLGADEAKGIFRYSKFGKQNPDSARPLCLSQRFHMAHSLARTVHQLHLVGWLHQNIRSENIWFTRELEEGPLHRSWILGQPYLFSFEYARKTDEYSDPYRISPTGSSDHNLYRHPERQDAQSKHYPHTKLHDMYSLGVVLLEIGLGRAAAGLKEYYQTRILGHDPHRTNTICDPTDCGPEQTKDGFLYLTQMLLSEKVGGKYASIVAFCLTGKFATSEEDGDLNTSLHKMFRRDVVEPLAMLADSV